MRSEQLSQWRLAAFWGLGLLAAGQTAAEPVLRPDEPNEVKFEPAEARFVRFVIHAGTGSEPCLDELEVYGPEGKQNLALAAQGAKASASSCLPGYPIHQIAHLNDGQYGNSHSWIAAGTFGECRSSCPSDTDCPHRVCATARAGTATGCRPRSRSSCRRTASNGGESLWSGPAAASGSPRPAIPSVPPPAALPEIDHTVLADAADPDGCSATPSPSRRNRSG